MKINLDMLLNRFKSQYPETTISPCTLDAAESIAAIRLLPPESAPKESSYLYLCDITHSSLPREQISEYYILCVCPDRIPEQLLPLKKKHHLPPHQP